MMRDTQRYLIRLSFMLGAAGALLILLTWLMIAGSSPAHAQTLGQHCYDVGPLPGQPPDWCGCTWGAVYVDRQPIAGAQVTLLFAGQTISTTSQLSAIEPFPFYAMSADDLGAKYGDVVTLTVTYRGQTLTRTVRLLPDTTGEQRASFAFSTSGHWERWTDLSNIQAIAVRDNDLWGGTATSLLRWDITTGISETYQTGLASPSIQALAVGLDGSIWAGTPAGLARYQAGAWSPQATGLASSNIRGLAAAPDGSVWAGASGATTGGVSRFDGAAWQPQLDFNGVLPNHILTLAADRDGGIWVGTDGAGASCWDGTTWRTFRAADGLASDIVYGIAAHVGAVWFGTFSYIDASGVHGGVGRYDLADGAWRRYMEVDGLAFDDVASVAVDATGRSWFGTWGRGVSLFDGHNWWTFDAAAGLSSDFVRALASGPDGSLWAGTREGVDRFRPGPKTAPPVIEQITVTPTSSRLGPALLFRATAQINAGSTIVSYEWQSEVDGALGSEASFSLPVRRLTPGAHTITVRALDDEGQWSEMASTPLEVIAWQSGYLPLVLR